MLAMNPQAASNGDMWNDVFVLVSRDFALRIAIGQIGKGMDVLTISCRLIIFGEMSAIFSAGHPMGKAIRTVVFFYFLTQYSGYGYTIPATVLVTRSAAGIANITLRSVSFLRPGDLLQCLHKKVTRPPRNSKHLARPMTELH